MDATRLLLIEDDEKLCRLLRDYLAPLGYVPAGRVGPNTLLVAGAG